MKAIKMMIIGIALFFVNGMNAQVSVNINIGSPPQWGPVGYTEVRYYYLPDVEAYYDIESSTFIYFGEGVWLHRTYLPARYKNYDLYHGYKVVMTEYRGDAPYNNFKEYKVKYKKGYHGASQKTIGEKPGKENSNSNKSSKSSANSPVNQDKEKGAGHSNGKANSSGNNKNTKSQSHGGGKGKK